MLFDRLLKKRRAAITKGADQASLAAMALHHDDPAVRLDAVRHLASLAHLRAILSTDADAGVREVALARYRHLLCGAEDGDNPPGERLAEIPLVEDPRILEHLAQEGREPEARLAAIERVTNPAVLLHCVLHDPRAANRAGALARIQDRATLEQVARRIGKKDTNVYREARERLRRLAEQEGLPQRLRAQCAELCERAEGLGRLGHWSQERALLDHLDRQWAQVDSQAESAWRERFQTARARFLAAYEEHHQANAAAIAIEEGRAAERLARQALIQEAEESADGEDEEILAALRTRLAADWGALGQGLPEPERKALARRFERALDTLDARLERLAERREGRRRLERIRRQLKAQLAMSKPLDQGRVRAEIAEARGLAKAALDSDGEDLSPLLEQLEARLGSQREESTRRLQTLPDRLNELEEALAGGALRRAEALHQGILEDLDLARLCGLEGGQVAASTGRLRSLSPRLKELQHWRRWGANQHRTALCEAMEALRDQDLPLAAVAERLHVLKADWKALDPAGGPVNRGLWNRFHQASEAVYARCRPVLEAEAAEREANRAAREAVCRQLEEFLARVDWGRIDWRRVMHAERETRVAWASIGPGDDHQRRPLERRFHRAIKELDERLEQERKRNQAFKQGLIARVRSLAEVADLDTAIEETKGLQRQWHTTVPARQREENRLWQEFRAACDAVFERRAALHQAHRAELEGNLRARESLCEEAETLAAATADSRTLTGAIHDLEQRWRDAASLAVPRQGANALARRWHQVQENLRKRVHTLESGERRATLDLLAQRAALCESVERQVLGLPGPASDVDLTGVRQAWSELPPLPDPDLQAALKARLDRALEAADRPDALSRLRVALGAGEGQRRRLALELEIAAGLDSPPELHPERLKLQVERLAERMAEGEADRLKGVPELLFDWYRCGPAPADPGLEARVSRVLDTWATAPPRAPEEAAE